MHTQVSGNNDWHEDHVLSELSTFQVAWCSEFWLNLVNVFFLQSSILENLIV